MFLIILRKKYNSEDKKDMILLFTVKYNICDFITKD